MLLAERACRTRVPAAWNRIRQKRAPRTAGDGGSEADARKTARPAEPEPIRCFGRSFSACDRAGKIWHQLYLDSMGSMTSFTGGVDGSAMVLNTGEERMTLRPEGGGKVGQIGEVTEDGGATWFTRYDLTYARSAAHLSEDR